MTMPKTTIFNVEIIVAFNNLFRERQPDLQIYKNKVSVIQLIRISLNYMSQTISG